MTTTSVENSEYQVVIVGAGMVGAALAAGLASSQISVALIEPNAPKAPPEHRMACEDFDIRVSAITAQNQALLTQLGVWNLINASKKSPYQEMTVWDAEGTGLIEVYKIKQKLRTFFNGNF